MAQALPLLTTPSRYGTLVIPTLRERLTKQQLQRRHTCAKALFLLLGLAPALLYFGLWGEVPLLQQFEERKSAVGAVLGAVQRAAFLLVTVPYVLMLRHVRVNNHCSMTLVYALVAAGGFALALHWQLRTRLGEGYGTEFNVVLWATALASGAALQLLDVIVWSATSPVRPEFVRSVGAGSTIGALLVPCLAVVQVIGSPDGTDEVDWWGEEATKASVSVVFFVLGTIGVVAAGTWWLLAGTLCCCLDGCGQRRGVSAYHASTSHALAVRLDALNDPDVPPYVPPPPSDTPATTTTTLHARHWLLGWAPATTRLTPCCVPRCRSFWSLRPSRLADMGNPDDLAVLGETRRPAPPLDTAPRVWGQPDLGDRRDTVSGYLTSDDEENMTPSTAEWAVTSGHSHAAPGSRADTLRRMLLAESHAGSAIGAPPPLVEGQETAYPPHTHTSTGSAGMQAAELAQAQGVPGSSADRYGRRRTRTDEEADERKRRRGGGRTEAALRRLRSDRGSGCCCCRGCVRACACLWPRCCMLDPGTWRLLRHAKRRLIAIAVVSALAGAAAPGALSHAAAAYVPYDASVVPVDDDSGHGAGAAGAHAYPGEDDRPFDVDALSVAIAA